VGDETGCVERREGEKVMRDSVVKGPRSKTQPVELRQLLSVEQLADLLQVPVSTIYHWRLRGEGPRPMRVGRYLRYEAADVARWIEGRKATG
jgi:excisionase family DNA binding protein